MSLKKTKCNLINLNWDSPEIYIDSIIDNYKNLGIKPSVSIISAYKDYDNNIYVYVMYSSIIEKCFINNKIKHILNCNCANIKYEKFCVNKELQVIYINDITYSYVNDLASIVLNVVKYYSNELIHMN